MATREQLISALRQADSAGNEEDAQRFAAMIKGMDSTEAPSETPVIPPAVEEFQPYQDERGNWVNAEPPAYEDTALGAIEDNVQGAGQTLLNAQLMGAGDEVAGAVRTGLDQTLGRILPNDTYDFGGDVSMDRQTPADQYEMYRADAKGAQNQFGEDAPGTALAANLVGGAGNPLNKIKMMTAGKGFLPRALESTARGAIEGNAAGYLENEQDRMAGAETGAKWGAGIAGGLSAAGGGLGKFASNRRVQEQLEQWIDDGKGGMKKVFQPLNMADPESLLGKFYRNVVGTAYGGGKIGIQESDYLNNAPQFARFADPETGNVVPRAVGTKRGLDDAKARISATAEGATDEIGQQATTRRAGLEQTREQLKRNRDAEKIAAERQANTQTRMLGEFDEQVVSEADEVIANAVPVANRAAVADVVEESIPSTMDDETIAAIRATDDPFEQEEIITSWWNKNAYSGIKERDFAWDAGLRDDIEEMAKNADAEVRAELDDIVSTINRVGNKSTRDGLEVVTEASQILDSSGNPIIPASVDEIETIDGDSLMNIRNWFAINANKLPSQKGKANRRVKERFDAMIEGQIPDDEVAQFRDLNNRYNSRRTLERSASQARNAARDITAKDLSSKARDKSSVQKRAVETSRQAESAKQAATTRKKTQLAKTRQKVEETKEAKTSATEAANKKRDAGLEQTKKQIAEARNAEREAKKTVSRQARDDRDQLERAKRGTLQEDQPFYSKAIAASALGLPFAAMTGAAGIPVAGIGMAKALSTPWAQKAAAGQLPSQELLARMLREGVLNPVTRTAAQVGARSAAEEEEY